MKEAPRHALKMKGIKPSKWKHNKGQGYMHNRTILDGNH